MEVTLKHSLLVIRVTGNCGHNLFILTGWPVVFRLSTWLKTICYTRSIFPWVRSVLFFLIPPCTRVNGVLESTQVVFGWRWGYILDTSPVQCNWRDNLHQQAIPLDCLACLELVFCGAKLVTLCVSFNPIPSIIYPAWKPYLLVLSSAVSDTHCLKVRSLK